MALVVVVAASARNTGNMALMAPRKPSTRKARASGDLCRLDDRQQVEFLTSSVPHLWELPEVLTTGKDGDDGWKTPPDFASMGGRDVMFVGLARRIGLSVDQALILIEALERVVCRIDSVPGVVGFLCK